MSAPILAVLEALPRAHRRGDDWSACCPSHDDKNPSLTWTTGTDGRVLMNCHAGCTNEAIVESMDRTMADLFEPSSNGHAPAAKPVDRRPTRKWTATDTAGKTWTHYRTDLNGEKRVWWAPTGVRVNALRPYGMETLTPGPDLVVMVEGEPAADALRSAGQLAVATYGTSYRPVPEALADLTGHIVVLWPDADTDPAKGRAHMLDMAARLRPIVAELRWIEPPADVPDGWDAANASREQIAALIQTAGKMPVDPEDSVAPRSERWEPPLSLDRRDDLPEFPVAGLPDWLGSFVRAEAEATQTPVDMAAMFGLAALATVTAGHVEVEPTAGWREGLNLFVAVAMEPGSRKSAVHRDINHPIVEYEQLLVEQAQPDITEQASIRRIAEAALAKAEKAAAAAKDPIERHDREEQARTYASALDRLEVPVPPRLFTDDVTPEKLASLLHENGGRMAVLSAEGGIFDIMAGRYSSGIPNIDVYLKGHAGDSIRVDRRGRPPEFVNRPALTVGLAVQPYVLAKAARIADFAGRGLLDRFLYSLPPGNVGYRKTASEPVPEAVRKRYDTTLRALAASFDRFGEPVTLRLSPDATDLFWAWQAELEPRRRPDADLGHIPGWSSKLDGAVVRIAGLLHLAETITTGWDTPITAATMTSAFKIGQYATAHALAAFGLMRADPRMDAARRIGRWITTGDHRAFTRREAFRALRGQALFPTIERLGEGLAALEDLGWVRQLPVGHGAGRPSAHYEANPGIFAGTWTKRPEPPADPEPDGVVSILSMDSEITPDAGEEGANGPDAGPEAAHVGGDTSTSGTVGPNGPIHPLEEDIVSVMQHLVDIGALIDHAPIRLGPGVVARDVDQAVRAELLSARHPGLPGKAARDRLAALHHLLMAD
jgi:replicative DNA helicase